MGILTAAYMQGAVQTAAQLLDATSSSKPKLRGVLHQYAAAAVFSAGAILIIEAPTAKAKLASCIYVAGAALQFVVSAVYHSGNWQPRARKLLKQLDHSAIYSLIAATYTPLILVALAQHSEVGKRLLLRIWLGAFFGVMKTWLWPNSPKPLSAAIYVFMGWSAVPYLRLFVDVVGLPVVFAIAIGGVLYSIGAFVYAMEWPNPYPQWFGFHEVFHALVVMASIFHFTSVYYVLVKMGPQTAGSDMSQALCSAS